MLEGDAGEVRISDSEVDEVDPLKHGKSFDRVPKPRHDLGGHGPAEIDADVHVRPGIGAATRPRAEDEEPDPGLVGQQGRSDVAAGIADDRQHFLRRHALQGSRSAPDGSTAVWCVSGGRRTALEERAVRQSGQDGGCLLVAVVVVIAAAATVVVVVVVIVVATPHLDLSGEDAAVGL